MWKVKSVKEMNRKLYETVKEVRNVYVCECDA